MYIKEVSVVFFIKVINIFLVRFIVTTSILFK